MPVSSILPPGPSLVLSLVPSVFGVPVIVYSALTAADTGISVWGRIGAAIAASLLQATVKILSTKFRLWRELKKYGARLFPAVPNKALLGSDIIDDFEEEEHRRGHLANSWTRWTETIGHTTTLNVMGDSFMVTIEPDYIKRMLATEFDNFEKGWQFTSPMESLLGNGVFNSDGEMWKFHRSMTRPFFSRERVSDFEIFARHTDEALNKLRDRLREGEAVDAQDVVSKFTLDSATEFLFGSCVNSLSDPLPYSPLSNRHRPANNNTASALFAAAFTRVQEVGAHRLRMGWVWKLSEPWKDKIADDMKVITAFIAPVIDKALQQEDERKKADQIPYGAPNSAQSTHEKVEEGETLLSHLVKTSRDRKLLQDETVNLLVAGRDTTASTLTWAIYILAMHPDIGGRLREEVLNDVGPNREPTFDDIRNMKYLRAFVNEILRLFPPVPFNVRTSKNATVWPSSVPEEKPFYIPAGTSINYSPFVMHRSTKYWGPDAAEFDPNRWLDDRLKKYLVPNPYIFLPFNAGPRICLGQQFAYNEVSFFIIRLLQTFDRFEIAEDMRPPEATPPLDWKNLPGRAAIENVVIKSHLTTFAKGGLWIRMREVEKDSAS